MDTFLRRSPLLVLLALIVAQSTPPAAQRAEPGLTPDDHAIQHLLLAAYPELRTAGVTTFRAGSGDVAELLVTLTPAHERQFDPPAGDPLLAARVRLDRGDVREFRATGLLVEGPRNIALREAILETRGRGLDISQTIDGAGVRYGTRSRITLEAQAPWRALEGVLGPLTLGATRPIGLTEHEAFAGDGGFAFVWSVELAGAGPNGYRRDYTLSFEPFSGRLVGLAAR